MDIMAWIGYLAGGILIFWVLLLMPRPNHPGWAQLQGWRFSHRGLHDNDGGTPENSLRAFRLAAEHGFGAELDVHLMTDGALAVVHDSSLKRVCGRDVAVESLTAAALAEYPLLGTEERIPLLEQVLPIFAGKAPLIIELKPARGNTKQLTDAVMARLKDYDGAYCIESFHFGVLLHLKRHYPEVVRGQLSQNFLRNSEVGAMPRLLALAMTFLLTTAFTRPDFIAYNYLDRRNPSLRLMRSLYGVHEVGWTIRDRETMEKLEAEEVVPIFEGFVP